MTKTDDKATPGDDLIKLAGQCEAQMIKATKLAVTLEPGAHRTAQRTAAAEFAIIASSLRAMHFGEHGLASITEEVVGCIARRTATFHPPHIEVTHDQGLAVAMRIEVARGTGEVAALNGVDHIVQAPGQAGKARALYLAETTGLPIAIKTGPTAQPIDPANIHPTTAGAFDKPKPAKAKRGVKA